ncbi:MAG: hypothetical protein K2N28_02445 [Muribaculaceae bacterium]|nr:hypothetical protein [Muribaculaceae bacterium]
MKKALFIVVLLTAWVGAQAQVFVGGTVGIDFNTVGSDGEGSVTTYTAQVAPEVGYRFNKTWTLGLQTVFGGVAVKGETISQVVIAPYVRATFARAGIVDFFGEASVGYGHQNYDGYDGVSGAVIALRPGMAINFSRRFAVIARTNLLQYEYWDGVYGVDFSINKGFSVGVQINF